MKTALIMCAGKAERLRPYNHIMPKACLPFLNLPLFSLAWFYLEHLKVTRFLLNSHLFPDQMKRAVDFVSQTQQKTELFFEKEPLGGAGTLYALKKELQKTDTFFYINGDSLFFPSSLNQLDFFEKDFIKSGAEVAFFCSPLTKKEDNVGALWSDKEGNLKFIGLKQNIPKDLKKEKLFPFYFSGLALFKSSLLADLNSESFHLFEDFIQPLLKDKKIKVFSDSKAKILEAGDKSSYLESLKIPLRVLFEESESLTSKAGSEMEKVKGQRHRAKAEDSKVKHFLNLHPPNKQNKELKQMLEEYLFRFDPKDQKVGLKNGRIWSQKLGFPIIAPSNVQGLSHLELQGFAVLGANVNLFGKSRLENSVLGSGISWRGELNKDMILKLV